MELWKPAQSLVRRFPSQGAEGKSASSSRILLYKFVVNSVWLASTSSISHARSCCLQSFGAPYKGYQAFQRLSTQSRQMLTIPAHSIPHPCPHVSGRRPRVVTSAPGRPPVRSFSHALIGHPSLESHEMHRNPNETRHDQDRLCDSAFGGPSSNNIWKGEVLVRAR